MAIRAVWAGIAVFTSAVGLPALYHAALTHAALQQHSNNVVETSLYMFRVIPWFVWAYSICMVFVGSGLLLYGLVLIGRGGRDRRV